MPAPEDLAAISIDFDLAADERAELDSHLETCPACRAHADGLRLDARTLADLPRLDAPNRVRRRIGPDPRPAWDMRFRLAAAVAGVFVIAVAVFAGTGGLRFGAGGVPSTAEPTGVAAASQAPAASPAPASSPAPATPTPALPTTAWEDVDHQSAFDPVAVTPEKDTSSPPRCHVRTVAIRPS